MAKGVLLVLLERAVVGLGLLQRPAIGRGAALGEGEGGLFAGGVLAALGGELRERGVAAVEPLADHVVARALGLEDTGIGADGAGAAEAVVVEELDAARGRRGLLHALVARVERPVELLPRASVGGLGRAPDAEEEEARDGGEGDGEEGAAGHAHPSAGSAPASAETYPPNLPP